MSFSPITGIKHPPRGGKILYDTQQEIAMTVNNDDVVITIATGKRALLYWGYAHNGSGQTINLQGFILDKDDKTIGWLYSVSRADGEYLHLPSSIETGNRVGNEAYPVLLKGGMKIKLRWAAAAGKAGTSKWFMQIQEFTP